MLPLRPIFAERFESTTPAPILAPAVTSASAVAPLTPWAVLCLLSLLAFGSLASAGHLAPAGNAVGLDCTPSSGAIGNGHLNDGSSGIMSAKSGTPSWSVSATAGLVPSTISSSSISPSPSWSADSCRDVTVTAVCDVTKQLDVNTRVCACCFQMGCGWVYNGGADGLHLCTGIAPVSSGSTQVAGAQVAGAQVRRVEGGTVCASSSTCAQNRNCKRGPRECLIQEPLAKMATELMQQGNSAQSMVSRWTWRWEGWRQTHWQGRRLIVPTGAALKMAQTGDGTIHTAPFRVASAIFRRVVLQVSSLQAERGMLLRLSSCRQSDRKSRWWWWWWWSRCGLKRGGGKTRRIKA